MQTVELTDGVITCRPFTLDDIDDHLAGEDEEQVKWLSHKESTKESVGKWIGENTLYWSQGGPIFCFAIVRTEDKKLLGMVETSTYVESPGSLKDGDANISYGLYPAARGKGYATRAIVLIENFLRERGIKRAVIRVNPQNEASLKVPKRRGYSETGKITTKEGELIIFVKEL